MKPYYLRKLRRQRRLTQEALAQAAGIAQNTISKLETLTTSMPSWDTVNKLAAVLKVNPRALRFGPEPGAPPRERRIDARPLKRRYRPKRQAALADGATL